MNLAGGLATVLFGITVLTVIGGLLAYGTYKARERARARAPKPVRSGRALEFFVEFALQDDKDDAPASLRGTPELPTDSTGLKVALGVGILLFAGAAGFLAFRMFFPGELATLPAVEHHGDAAPAPSGSGPKVARVPRGSVPDLAALPSRRPSLFVNDTLDLNVNGRVDPEERALIQSEVPQFVVIGCDDNGAHEGLAWMRQLFEAHKVWGRATFFMTGNYLEGRPNWLGGPLDAWWQVEVYENWIGLHGLTHAPGADGWTADRWLDEQKTTQTELEKRFKMPEGWAWKTYPLGTRAPFLLFTDAYFQALSKLDHKPIYDSSLVSRPPGVVPAELSHPRDLPWPFTLDWPLPPEIELPYLASTDSRAQIGKHPGLWEIPVYAWLLKVKGKPEWQPSLDYNLWKFYGCTGSNANDDAVDAIVDNLRGHYRGNRAPFHIGLHAQNYTKDKPCERATIAKIFDQIDRLVDEGYNLRYVSMPELLMWVGKPKK